MSAPYKPERRANGTFAPGSSGCLTGRRKKQAERIKHPEEVRDMVLDVGEFPVPVTIDGVTYRVPLLQANYLTLGIKGASGHAISARQFVSQHRAILEQEIMDILDRSPHSRFIDGTADNVSVGQSMHPSYLWWDRNRRRTQGGESVRFIDGNDLASVALILEWEEGEFDHLVDVRIEAGGFRVDEHGATTFVA